MFVLGIITGILLCLFLSVFHLTLIKKRMDIFSIPERITKKKGKVIEKQIDEVEAVNSFLDQYGS